MDVSIQLHFPALVELREIPEALVQGLQYRGVELAKIDKATRDCALLQKCAICIADVTGVPCGRIKMNPVCREPNPRIAFVSGLMRSGVTAKQLSDIVCDEYGLDRLAHVVLSTTESKQNGDRVRVLEYSNVRGVGYEEGFSLIKRFVHARIVDEETADEFRSAEISWLKRGIRTFRVMPSTSLMSCQGESRTISYCRLVRAFSEKYTRFKPEHVPPPLALALAKSFQSSPTPQRLEGISWVLVLHEPLIDKLGHRRIVRIIIGRNGSLEKVMLDEYPEQVQLNERGAFAVLVD